MEYVITFPDTWKTAHVLEAMGRISSAAESVLEDWIDEDGEYETTEDYLAAFYRNMDAAEFTYRGRVRDFGV